MKTKKNILILGAGPAGLAAAYELSKYKDREYNVIIIESDSKVGGLSKTINFNGYYFDLGGHRFFSKIEEVNKLWEDTLKDDFLRRPRISRIYYKNKFYDYPLKVGNALFNLGLIESFLILLSYLKQMAFPYKKETTFEEWVSNRFGKRLYSKFFKTYTEKVWGIPCNQIQAEWAAQRIKGLSLLSAVMNALQINKNKIKTLIDRFDYPKFGPGMMYAELVKKILKENKNSKILMKTKITGLIKKGDKWEAIIENNKTKKSIIADEVISSIPITDLIQIIKPKVQKDVLKVSQGLKYRGFLTACLVFDGKTPMKDTWIYMHDNIIKMGRLQVMKNWSPYMIIKNEKNSSFGAEYFCSEGDEIWNMKDEGLVNIAVAELKKTKLIPKNYNLLQGNIVRYKKTYPVYDEYYKKNIHKIREYVSNLKNLQVIGRNGMFKYNNMDHSIYNGLLASRNVIMGRRIYDLWKINQDDEYHEEEKIKKVDAFEVNLPLKAHNEVKP